jgi:hypothetical protein
LASGVLSGSILTGSISESVGSIVLASLLYVVLRDQNRVVALVALGWWLAEAVILAVSTLGVYALIPLSLQYVQAGTPASSYYQTLGTLFLGVDQNAYAIHMLFFCLGALL